MVPTSSYQPFLIGQFKTGQFNYLQPWQSPEEAFEPLINAYVYRGSLHKRQGYQECGYTGLLRYENCEIEAGDGGTTYNWTTIKFPITPSSITVTSVIGGVTLTATDDGAGGFAGALAGVGGTVDYTTGAITFEAAAAIAATQVITLCYTFTNSLSDEVIGIGDGTTTVFSGNLTYIPVVPLSIEIITTTASGTTTIFDDGRGNLIGNFVDVASFIDYTSGAWNINFTSAVTNLTDITATYIQVGDGSPIMGINFFENEDTGNQTMTVQDQNRMAVFNTGTRLFDPVSSFSQEIWSGDGVSTSFTMTLPFTNIAPYSVSISDGTNTITDIPGVYPLGTFTTSATINQPNTSTINYATGAIFISFNAAPATTVFVSISASLQGDYFTGGNTNFFHFANWKANDSLPSYLYLTNNKDRITLFDGTNLSRPAFPILEAQIQPQVNGIVTCLDIKVYKNRLLLFRPTVNTFATGAPLVPTGTLVEGPIIRFSSEFYTFGTSTFIPFDFVADVSGHGGLTDAPTPDWIVSAEFLRDAIVAFFQKSVWVFRFTGSSFSPFRWDKINSSRTTNAPYGSLDYDDNVTAMGTKGLIFCDGVNVDRYDLAVIDQYTDIDNDNFIQCNSARDDILNQSWMTYPSVSRDVSNAFSDKAIIYNFLEKTFSTYHINLTTLGVENTFSDMTWASFAPGSGQWVEGLTWREANFTWNKFVAQSLTPQVFGGDQNGYVYILNVTETDNGGHIDVNVRSRRWNPFIQSGQRCRVGYIDIYYEINPDVTLQIDIFFNNSQSPNITKYMVLEGNVNDDFAWKRLYVNMQGEFIRMNISTPILNEGTGDEDLNNGTFLIPGIIVWAMPAGRLTPGVYS